MRRIPRSRSCRADRCRRASHRDARRRRGPRSHLRNARTGGHTSCPSAGRGPGHGTRRVSLSSTIQTLVGALLEPSSLCRSSLINVLLGLSGWVVPLCIRKIWLNQGIGTSIEQWSPRSGRSDLETATDGNGSHPQFRRPFPSRNSWSRLLNPSRCRRCASATAGACSRSRSPPWSRRRAGRCC